MCDICESVGSGWKGWSELPDREIGSPCGEWIDLSYPVSPEMPCASIFERPSVTRVREMPANPFNVTELKMVVHAGTHVDSPRHYYLDGPAFEDIPLDRLGGPGVVWDIPMQPCEIIDVAHLEQGRPQLRSGDILAIDTGWADRFGTDEYELHPSLSPEAAVWLANQNIKLLACDFATPDLVYHLREPGFNWPVHHTLLSRGILICEHLRGHSALAGKHVEFMLFPINIAGSDGAPVRAVARQIKE